MWYQLSEQGDQDRRVSRVPHLSEGLEVPVLIHRRQSGVMVQRSAVVFLVANMKAEVVQLG